MATSLNNSENTFQKIDSFGASLVQGINSGIAAITPDLKSLAEKMKKFQIKPEPLPSPRKSPLKYTLIKVQNNLADYHQYVINKSGVISKKIGKKAVDWTRWILTPMKFIKTTSALQEVIAQRISHAIGFVSLVAFQVIGHILPYLTLAALVGGAAYLYWIHPLALAGIFTGIVLVIQLYVLHLLQVGVEDLNKNAKKIAKNMNFAAITENTIKEFTLLGYSAGNAVIQTAGKALAWATDSNTRAALKNKSLSYCSAAVGNAKNIYKWCKSFF